jgi:hypothetical protein
VLLDRLREDAESFDEFMVRIMPGDDWRD